MSTLSNESSFSLTESRRIVKDLFRPNPAIYWFDFLLTYGTGIYCFQQVRGGTLLQPHQGFTGEYSQACFFLASCLLFYRASMFIHELVHQRGELTVFRVAWNILCGIPFLMPSFVYYTHIDHHRRKHFGTDHDGEYIPLCRRGIWFLAFYLSWVFVIPIVVVFRFLVLSPIAWVWPELRKWVHRHASSLVMDPTYIRPLPSRKMMRVIYAQELGCFLWCLSFAVIPPLFLGRWPIPFVIHAYLTGVVIVAINSIRTIGSHRWNNDDNQEMTFVDQLMDSVNYPNGGFVAEAWGPVGSRYHALHHLFPSLPYHAMPEAHRRLMNKLPADSLYRQTNADSLTEEIVNLVRKSAAQ